MPITINSKTKKMKYNTVNNWVYNNDGDISDNLFKKNELVDVNE